MVGLPENISDLWDQYIQSRDIGTKNELVMHYLYLVRNIVLRMMPNYQNYNDYDDLISCGVLGLMDAVDKYDPSREIKFETYAFMRVRGEIIDHMRKQDWAPSSLRRKISKAQSAFEELEVRLGRSPHESEVAEFLDMSEGELQGILQKSHTFNLLYFEDLLETGSGGVSKLEGDEQSPGVQVEKLELRDKLAEIIDELPENERLVVTLYYFEELSLKDIASILGVSASRVSQLHSKVLLRLKNKLQMYI